MLAAVIVGPTEELARKQIQQALKRVGAVEIRVDSKSVIQNCPVPAIVTVRDSLERLASYLPAYIDISHDVALPELLSLKTKYPTVKHILSYHNYDEVPDGLEAIYEKPADLYKVAVTPKNTLEALFLLLWAKQQRANTIVIGMGSYGEITRILMRGPITYAAISPELASAPGQLTVDALLDMYRFNEVSEKSQRFGLIGDPVDKSISNVTHNRAFKGLGLDAVYVKMNVKASELSQFLPLAKEAGFCGLSVTMPLKEAVMEHIDYIDPQAARMGAVNTLKLIDGKWHGFNTDGLGALNALGSVAGKNVLILGAGGAAKAIAYEAHSRGAHVIIANRSRQKADDLAKKVQGVSCSLDTLCHYDIMINCTPSLMPIEQAAIIPGSTVMDIHTRPVMTDLLVAAQNRGCTLVYGYQMFIEQAVGQFAIWFDGKIDQAICRGLFL